MPPKRTTQSQYRKEAIHIRELLVCGFKQYLVNAGKADYRTQNGMIQKRSPLDIPRVTDTPGIYTCIVTLENILENIPAEMLRNQNIEITDFKEMTIRVRKAPQTESLQVNYLPSFTCEITLGNVTKTARIMNTRVKIL